MLIQCCLAMTFAAGLPEPAAAKAPADSVRRVLAEVVRAAEENAARTQGRLEGDALAHHYIRRAAAAAAADNSPSAFLVGLGIALDDTNTLRKNPVFFCYLRQIESDQERERRLRSLGKPTLARRHDWLLHYAVAAALTAHLGADTAEGLSIAKELADARGASGFSFTDLAADFAGIALARRLLENEVDGEHRLRDLAERFTADEYLPRVDDLEDSLTWEQFAARYGGIRDVRFLRMCAVIRHRAWRVPGLHCDRD